jgi:ABC-type molybdate transport system substrate-binding protein
MPHHFNLVLATLLLLVSSPAHALGTVTVLADNTISVPLVEASREYTRTKGVIVNASFATADLHKKQLEESTTSDVLITPNVAWLDELKAKGFVDVPSKTVIAGKPSETSRKIHYTAVALTGENMEQARKFIDYLKSDNAREIFRGRGFSAD